MSVSQPNSTPSDPISLAAYRTLFGSIDEAFALCELVRDTAGRPVDYRILSMNQTMEVLSGIGRGSAIGHLRSEFAAPDPEALERFARAAESGRPHHFAAQHAAAFGRWLETSVFPQGGDRFALLFRDITQRKEAEAQQAWLAAVVASSTDAIIGRDLDGAITSWNPAAETLFGYTVQEVLGRPASILAPPARLAEVEEHLACLRQGNAVSTLESQRQRKDGTILDVSLSSSPVRDSDGCLIGSANIMRDITHEKQLVVEQERLAAVVTSADDAILTRSLDGRIASWNAAAERLFGYTAQEAIGKPLTLIIPPDRAAEFATVLAQFQQGEPVVHRETVRQHKDGRRIDVWTTVSQVRDSDGTVIGLAGIYRDITERKQVETALRESEERFRQVANLVPDLLWSSTVVGYPDWYNQRCLDYTGQTLEEARATGWRPWLHPDEEAMVFANAQAVGVEETFRQELRIRGADGHYRWFLVCIEPVLAGEGGGTRWFGAATDIHEEWMAREELAARVREATAGLRALSRRLLTVQEEERRHLARELHDEIGQVLTGLQLQLAAKGDAGRLAEAEQLVQELTTRVRELSMDLRPTTLDTLGLLPALLTQVERFQARTGLRIDLRHLGLERRFSPEVEITVYRVVQEALTNIVRHARASSATVQLLADAAALTLVVWDDGDGFDPEVTSTGGGLSGMRERVELLGGTLTVEAPPGGGTLLTAELPLS
jgi:PAS domain S-box-containing protein